MGQKNRTSRHMLMTSSIMFGISCLLFISVTLAWFGFTARVGTIDLLVGDADLNAALLYYDAETSTWIDTNVITDPLEPGLFYFDNIKPNDKYYYKIIVINDGNINGTIGANINNIVCEDVIVDGLPKCLSYRMQIRDVAVYSGINNGTEIIEGELISDPLKDVGSDKFLMDTTIVENVNTLTIVENYVVGYKDIRIIHFALWFNPTEAYDPLGTIIENNSNAYSNSHLKINSVYVYFEQLTGNEPTLP